MSINKVLFVLLFATGILAACKSRQENSALNKPGVRFETLKKDTVPQINITEAQLADKHDPVCGMPVFAELEDTVMIKAKIYGFCSRECKAEFVKSPAAYLLKEKK